MNWLTKKKGGGKGYGDVYISEVCKSSNPAIAFRFTKEALSKITKNQYIKFALKGSRIYFDEAESNEGWKLCSSYKSNNVFFKVKKITLPTTGIEVGGYDLKFDEMFGYYYIDVKDKINDLSWRK